MSDIREIVRRLQETDPAEPIGKLRMGTAGIAQKNSVLQFSLSTRLETHFRGSEAQAAEYSSASS